MRNFDIFIKYITIVTNLINMAKFEIIGQKFGRLTVLEYIDRNKGYLCECECGNKTNARSWSLKTGRHESCGCLAKEKLAKRNFKEGFIALKNEIYKNYSKAAKRRGYSFELTKDEFFELIAGNCEYCGIKPSTEWFGTKRTIIDTSEFKYNGVDRVDNNEGYTIENSVSCCKFCNNAKNTMTTEEFMEWITRVYKYQQGKN